MWCRSALFVPRPFPYFVVSTANCTDRPDRLKREEIVEHVLFTTDYTEDEEGLGGGDGVDRHSNDTQQIAHALQVKQVTPNGEENLCRVIISLIFLSDFQCVSCQTDVRGNSAA